MIDRSLKQIPWILIMAMAALALSVGAEEPAAETEPTAAKKDAPSMRNVLQWRTATEVDNFGYDVYRGESEDGPFERLNPDPIPGAGTSDEPSSYEFIDTDIDPYTTYWYYLESVSMSGVKERFTPIFRKKAKKSREPSDPETGSDTSGSGSEQS